jgi:hypothetical protein
LSERLADAQRHRLTARGLGRAERHHGGVGAGGRRDRGSLAEVEGSGRARQKIEGGSLTIESRAQTKLDASALGQRSV